MIKKTEFSTVIRKKRLLQSSRFGSILNRIGRRRNFLECYGCGDSLWWKKDVDIAFQGPRWRKQNESEYVQTTTSGMLICLQCFIKRTENELISIFDDFKMGWMNRNPLDGHKIIEYELLRPIRTTGRVFKKEVSKTKGDKN